MPSALGWLGLSWGFLCCSGFISGLQQSAVAQGLLPVVADPAAGPGNEAAVRELQQLTAQLTAISARVGRDDSSDRSGPLRSIWEHVALFEMRFGVEPRELPAWRPFAAEAAALVSPTAPMAGNTTGLLNRSMLLDWSGDPGGAAALLESIQRDDWAFDGCALCRLEHGVVHEWHRAELALRRGDESTALRLVEAACLDLPDSIIHFGGHAELLAWYGQALSAAGHDELARAVWRGVAGSYPSTIGADAARRSLGSVSDTAEPSRLRPLRIRFQAKESSVDGPSTAKILVVHDPALPRVIALATVADDRSCTLRSVNATSPELREAMRVWSGLVPLEVFGREGETTEAGRQSLVESLRPFGVQ